MIRLADDLRNLARKSSVRLHALMILVASLYQIMPALDPGIAHMLPVAAQAKAIGLYAIVGLILRVTKVGNA